jgi:predicted component of type VI protein secretion system
MAVQDLATAERPFREALIHLKDDNPDYYLAHIYLKPRYQLKALDTALRVVFRLPRA